MMKLEHVALWTRDPERLRDYYVNHFQGVSGPMYQNTGKRFRSYFVTFESGLRLELMSVPGIAPKNGGNVPGQQSGWTHIAFEVATRDDVDWKARDLQQQGFQIVDGPRVTGDGYYEFATLDPDGNRLEVSTPAHHETAQPEIPVLTLETMDQRFAVCLLPPEAPLPGWATASTFLSVTRTREETSLVCPAELVPEEEEAERDYRMFRVKGVLDFSMTGILAQLLGPLKEGKIPVFVLSTYRTDYLLVRGFDYEKAHTLLSGICRIEKIRLSPENSQR